MTIRLGEVQTSSGFLLPRMSPLENASSPGLHDTHSLVFFWPLLSTPVYSPLLVPLPLKYHWKDNTSRDLAWLSPHFTDSLWESHSWLHLPLMTSNTFFEATLIFRTSKSSMYLPAGHSLLMWAMGISSTTGPKLMSSFPKLCSFFCIPVLSTWYPFPAWNSEVIWDYFLSLAPKLVVQYVLLKL